MFFTPKGPYDPHLWNNRRKRGDRGGGGKRQERRKGEKLHTK